MRARPDTVQLRGLRVAVLKDHTGMSSKSAGPVHVLIVFVNRGVAEQPKKGPAADRS